ncbi:hypothetical protein SAMN05216266_10858 [Amycolatopsis marina]|uniref:Uncharacterized protein n=1 Tax=Amycolatopsis marina TaxID=490629 RepID=A0A1I0ZZW3_9PSEU|nr:hypothetical protein SAMN05216266_10858 [Amycolatopsis marina]
MDDLTGGVDTGVSSACDDYRAGDGGAWRLVGQRRLEDTLNGSPIRLPGPAREVSTVVTDIETQTDEPALPVGSGGLVRDVSSCQDSSSEPRCDGGNWKPAASAASALANQTSAVVCL